MARKEKPLDATYCEHIKAFFQYIWVNDIKSLLSDEEYFFQLSPQMQKALGGIVLQKSMNNFKYFFDFFEEGEFKICLLRYLRPVA